MKSKFIITLFISLGAVACNTGNEYGYGFNDWYDYDVNEDEVVIREEFDESWKKSGNFENWDTNGDGFLSKEEWMESHNDYFLDWDNEVYGYYEEWDVNDDNQLEAREVAMNTYEIWDSNADGQIQKKEFDKWNRQPENDQAQS